MEKILKLAVIGCGGRGQGWIRCELINTPGVMITCVCDIYPDRAEEAATLVEDAGFPRPAVYYDYKILLKNEKSELDGVLALCDWINHIPVARASMKAGIPVGIEVGGANSLDECYELVRVSEDTGVTCMLLENCCYDRHEMAVLNMVRKGVLGELIHCTCGYEHDLRDEICLGWDNRHYRLDNFIHRNGDNYPTHGIGPVAKYLNINRGNRFVSLTSMTTKSRALETWATVNLPPDHSLQGRVFNQGDVVTTMIKCANGETIVCTMSCSLPRPYSRAGMVQGVKGIWKEDGTKLHIDGRGGHEDWIYADEYLKEFEHPLWIAHLEEGEHKLGHGGMDYLTKHAFLYSIRNGIQPPIDVYDTATWMAVTVLSEMSIALGGQTLAFPDFTGGKWIKREPSPQNPYSLD